MVADSVPPSGELVLASSDVVVSRDGVESVVTSFDKDELSVDGSLSSVVLSDIDTSAVVGDLVEDDAANAVDANSVLVTSSKLVVEANSSSSEIVVCGGVVGMESNVVVCDGSVLDICVVVKDSELDPCDVEKASELVVCEVVVKDSALVISDVVKDSELCDVDDDKPCEFVVWGVVNDSELEVSDAGTVAELVGCEVVKVSELVISDVVTEGCTLDVVCEVVKGFVLGVCEVVKDSELDICVVVNASLVVSNVVD